VETVFRCSSIPRDAGPELRSLVVVPLFHVTGCHSQTLPTLRAGGTVVIDAAFDGGRMIQTLQQERITACTAVPAIYYYILNHPEFAPAKVAGVRWASYGGAPIAPALVHQIGERFAAARLANGFGLTESTSIATVLPHEWAAGHADSVGFAAPHTEVAIDTGAGPGEILIRGQSVCDGYWHNPEATVQGFAEGWLHTGDVGRIGPEGLVYVLDRIKDMINRGGENVYCVEVENALIGAPGVGEVAVVGVPDDMMGEKVGVVIVPLPGASVDPKVVVDYAREHLADFKVPQFIAVSTTPLPRNPNGKVLKGRLRDSDFGAPIFGLRTAAPAAQPGGAGLQVALLREAQCPPGRGLVAVAGARLVPGRLQQVPADRVQPVIPGDPLVGFEAGQQVEPGLRAPDHGHRDGVVQRHHRVVRDPQQ
jgi:acyl-CoA synthetase (AMP-forming)/AMP-acid ligase II